MIFNKLSTWTIILLCLYVINLQAQTKVWGAGASNGVAYGEFQNSFITTGTAGNYAPNSWTALSIYDNNTVAPGNAYWEQNLLGYSQGPFSSFTPIPSPSQANGIALFDSDFLASSMTSLTTHKGALISPKINLTNYKDSALVVQFFSEYKGLSLDELSISMSIDSGTTWSSSIDYRVFQDSASPSWVRVHFPNITNGINNLSNCRLRFIFEGAYYYAAIDDVSIETASDYDIAIAIPDPNSSILAERGDFIKIGGNKYQALSNLPFSNWGTHQWNFGLRAINYGTKKLLPTDSSRIRLNIDVIDPVTGAITPSVYMDTLYLGDTLLENGQNSVIAIDQLRDLSFLYIYGAGTYCVQYWVEHKHADGSTGNDTAQHTFTITGSWSSYLSKAALDPSDQKVRATSAIFPAGSLLTAFEYGSMYYFSNIWGNNVSIESIDFRYFVPPNYTGGTSDTLFVSIYQFTDGVGDTLDGYIDPNGNELLQVGLGIMTLSGLGTTVSLGSYGLGNISNIVNAATGGPMAPLSGNKYYIVSIMQHPTLLASSSIVIDSTNSIWFGVDDQNYAMNMSLSNSSTTMEHPFISRVIDTSTLATPQFSWEEYRLNMVPSIGINITHNNIICPTNEVQTSSIGLSISPNPSSDVINLKTELSEPSKIEYIITNISGQVLGVFNSTASDQEVHSLDIRHLPTGTYFVTVRTTEGEYTQPFIKN